MVSCHDVRICTVFCILPVLLSGLVLLISELTLAVIVILPLAPGARLAIFR